jgi:hypothetical protein
MMGKAFLLFTNSGCKMREIEDLRSVLKGAEWSSSGTPIAAQPSFLSLAVFAFHPLHLRSPHDDIVRREMLRILINTILGELLEKLPKASSIWLFSLIKPTIFSPRQHKNCASFLSHALGASIESFHSSSENSGISSPVTQAAPVVILSFPARNLTTFS